MEALKNLKLVSLFLGGLVGEFGFLFVGLESPKTIDELKTFEKQLSTIYISFANFDRDVRDSKA